MISVISIMHMYNQYNREKDTGINDPRLRKKLSGRTYNESGKAMGPCDNQQKDK